ncbi:MAG: VWA domain-containing protein [Planctomyces sp.]|nr:VWA domain-containing protein [Planctomyces sp.]
MIARSAQLFARTASRSDRRGAILVFLAIGIVMLLAMAVLSVDVAFMQLTRTELRAASDASAKAGVEALLRTQNVEASKAAAIAMAGQNKVGGKALTLGATDIVVGRSTLQPDGSWTFTSDAQKPNAVRVNASMAADSGSGPVNLVFGRVFGSSTFEPVKTATASVLEQEICLVIDRSASMAWDNSGVEWSYPPGGAYDRKPHASLSRWAALNRAVEAYLAIASTHTPPPRVSLVTWASNISRRDPISLLWGIIYRVVQLDVPLTTTLGQITDSLLDRGEKPILGATNMSSGIDEGVRVLTAANVKPFAQKNLILMTDGQWNEGRNPILAAQDARDQGIVIHVVTFLPAAWTAEMTQVAALTGGHHIHADSESELIAAFEELARMLPVVLTE